MGGAGITWLKNTLGALEKPEDSEEIASSVPDTAGKHFQIFPTPPPLPIPAIHHHTHT